MVLTTQQQQALKAISEFLNSDIPVFILKGYAGTGKTTMISQIISEIKKLEKLPLLMAPTGRAARVLETKTGYEAFTIHRMIYELDEIETKEDSDDIRYIFPLKDEEDLAKDHICIVDESSMIGTREVQNELFEFGTGSLLNDLLTFVAPHRGGKIVFVGDPMQLPPVGDNKSNALDEDYFEKIGLKVKVSELTDVVRQDNGSAILSNAMKVRALLESSQRNNLVFERKENEVLDIEGYNMPTQLLSIYPKPEIGQSVIITYSNRQARDYNYTVREVLYPGQKQIVIGDILQVVSNNYGLNVMNGDFVKIVDVLGDSENQSAPVYVTIGNDRVQQNITLTFRNVRVRLDNGKEFSCKIIENMLDDADANLSFVQIQALYINFCMRHPGLKRNSQQFKEYLKNDPYYNALRVKYGYAITGHKSQGGEWATVFVDYTGRTGLSNDSLRWTYTVTTRASQVLYGCNMPNVTPMSRMKVAPIIKVTKPREEYLSFSDIPETPFHQSSASNFLKAKYWIVSDELKNNGCYVKGVESKSYCEWYRVEDDKKQLHTVQCFYNKAGLFTRYIALDNMDGIIQILSCLQVNMTPLCSFRYNPSSEVLLTLYNNVESICSDLDVKITNIVEHLSSYCIYYYLQTSGSYACIQFFITKDGFISYAQPFSDEGLEDGILKSVVERLCP
ncbi:ATP-dependent RecD-like DNA helicase [Prevotella sp. E2-28]|uniref:ATP-dependent DNA helicase n=1 Tax=Prevotella sp. E2-28 TaxID=2913620 RepID=UPI001EDB6F28|nr:AAA family ATPase [Prevotella sp. E2-28]UKK54566.1 AAA family ATPase [Prevotella sp. E2-28]